MTTTIAELVATLGLDASGFTKEIDQVQNKSSGLSNTLSGLATVGAGVFAAGLTAAAGGAALLGTELYKDIGIAQDSQKVQAQLEAVIKSTGGTAGVTADAADNLAQSLMKVTTFDDEAIKSGESMLLTFTNIGKDVFPQATSTTLDMSQALGQDLQSSAIQLGKALNDPIKGVTALQRVGVTFTDAQKATIQSMMDVNDVAGAQKVILAELAKEFGGSAQAAGQTAAGQMTIFKNTIDNIRESVGAKFLPILVQLGNTLQATLTKPEVLAFIDQLSTGIANFAQTAVTNLPVFIQKFQEVVLWLQNNQPIVIGILSALGVALLAFGVTSAIAAATAIAPLLPIIAILVGIGLAVALLAQAWKTNWGDIQGKTAAVISFVHDGFMGWYQLFTITIPNAIQTLKDRWNAGFAGITSAVQKVMDFIQRLRDKLLNIHLPSWLTPGSPTPFELGLLGIADALKTVNQIGFAPNLSTNNMALPAAASGIGGASSNNEPKQVSYHFEINNPKGETTEQSTTKTLKKLSYLGVPA